VRNGPDMQASGRRCADDDYGENRDISESQFFSNLLFRRVSLSEKSTGFSEKRSKRSPEPTKTQPWRGDHRSPLLGNTIRKGKEEVDR